MHLSESPPKPRDLGCSLPTPLELIVLKCLEKAPAKRCRDFDEVERLLQQEYVALLGQAWTPPEPSLPAPRDAVSGLVLQAMSLASLDDHAAAVAILEEALAAEPDHRFALYDLGQSYTLLGEQIKALECYRRLQELGPGDLAGDVDNVTALALNECGRHDLALQYAERAVQAIPDDFSSWNNRAIALTNLGRLDEALDSLDRAIELDPFCAEAWRNRGFVMRQLGRNVEARSDFERAIELNVRYSQPYFNLGELSASEGQVAEALSWMTRVLEIDPDNQDAQRIISALSALQSEDL